MKKLALLLIAAGAAVSAAPALAQQRHGPGAPPRVNLPHPNGGNWNGGGNRGGNWNNGGNRGGNWNRGNWGGNWGNWGGGNWGGNWGGGGGFAFGGFFFQPQYQVQNWQLYGFINPGSDRRWIRYYDDAFLIDQYGRVFDRRAGVPWDSYGERWERDERGMPYYGGRGDGRRHDRDGDRMRRDRHDRDGYDDGYEEYGYVHGSGRGGPGYPPPPPPPGACGYGCGGSGAYGYSGYGSGYGSAYGYGVAPGSVIVTETTVTPITTTITEEVIEEVIEERAGVRRHRSVRRPAPVRRHHAPPPAPPAVTPPGERG